MAEQRSNGYVLCVTLNPVLDTTYFVDEMNPVYRTEAQRVTFTAGGKGNNVARALGVLGAPARSLVAVGGMIGRNLVETWRADPFEGAPVWVSGETRLQVTVIDKDGAQRAFFAPGADLSAEDVATVASAFAELVDGASAVCICGSSPGPAADPLYARFIELGRERGVLTFLDTYGRALEHGMAARPHVVKVNLAEAEGFLGRKITDWDAEPQAVQSLLVAGATDAAVLTLGERGALLATHRGVWHGKPPPGYRAVNPIGSGDAMTAGMVWASLQGLSPVSAFRVGMTAAVANTQTWEACRFDPADIVALYAFVDVRQLEKTA